MGNVTEKVSSMPNIVKLVVAGGTSLVLLILLMAGCTAIPLGSVGIVVSKVGKNRGVQGVTMKTGWALVNPITTSLIEYPVYMQTVKWTAAEKEGNPDVDESITFNTKDEMTINADVSLSYMLEESAAPAFYVKYRARDIETFTDGYLRNVARDAFNEVAGDYSIEQIMGDNGPVLQAVRNRMQSVLKVDGIQISQLGFMGSPRAPKQVSDAINLKVQAAQIALQKENEVAQAKAEAQKMEAIAQGDAQANIIRAQADATANKLRSSTLTPELIEWNKIQRWDGHNPSVVSGAGAGSLMLSVK
jgi:regulator of protease activity HflC (stomatin/prohibitin superfamily)